MDEIPLRRHLFYDVSSDRLARLEGYGDGKISGCFVTSVPLLIIGGMLNSWK